MMRQASKKARKKVIKRNQKNFQWGFKKAKERIK